jgi:hypothetical protein
MHVIFVIALINSNEKLGVYLYALIANSSSVFECATFSLVVRHKHEDHILKLTYSVEAHCEEYYCII